MIDTRPRRVWIGVTIPGKKMMRALGAKGLDVGRELNRLYQDAPHTVLLMVAHAFHALPKEGAMGPAARNLNDASVGSTAFLYGAVLTDMRDFLKLRFRVEAQPVSAGRLAETDWPDGTELGPSIHFIVGALDALAKESITDFEELIIVFET